jgi:radical SAM superfamily enzyme YgiQ (UPF0313 family)
LQPKSQNTGTSKNNVILPATLIRKPATALASGIYGKPNNHKLIKLHFKKSMMFMKIALLSPYSGSQLPPLGLGYLASYIEKYTGYKDIKVIDSNVHNVTEELKKQSPDTVGITATSDDYGKAIKYGKWIKENLDVPVFIGGVHISTLPTSLADCFDFGIIGEGEQTFLELFRVFEKKSEFTKEDLEKINGVAFKRGGVVTLTGARDLIQYIDNIPFPKRDLFDMNFYLKPRTLFMYVKGVGTSMLTSRGCPYNCVFCSTKNFWKKARLHSAEYVVGEIEELLVKYPKIKIISIYDDLFIMNRERIRKISSLLIEKGINEKINFNVTGRTNLINDDICRDLKAMNVRNISFGMESGSQRILNYLKKDTLTVEHNYNAINTCKKAGIRTDGSFILGSPGETKEDMRKTIDFIYNSGLDTSNVFILAPFPGTEIWEIAKERGIVSEDMDWGKINMGSIHNSLSDNVSREELEKIYKEAQKAVKTTSFSKYDIDLEFIKAGLPQIRKSPLKLASFLFRIAAAKTRMKLNPIKAQTNKEPA